MRMLMGPEGELPSGPPGGGLAALEGMSLDQHAPPPGRPVLTIHLPMALEDVAAALAFANERWPGALVSPERAGWVVLEPEKAEAGRP